MSINEERTADQAETTTQLRFDRRTILSNITLLFSSSAIAQFLTSIGLLLLARVLGPETYGQYTSSMTLALFCSIFFNLGLNLWILREGGKEPSKIGTLIGSVLGLMGIIGIVWLAIMLLLSTSLASTSFPAKLVRLGCLFILITTIFNVSRSAFKSILRNNINFFLETASAVVDFSLMVYLIFIGINRAEEFLQARIIVALLSLTAALVFSHRLLKLTPKISVAKRALFKSPPYAVSELLGWMYMRLDILIVAVMLNEYAVGIYAPAVGIVNAIFLVPTAVHVVILPVLSNQFSNNSQQAWRTARNAILLLTFIGLALFGLLFLGSELVPILLGQAYVESASILKILSIVILFQSINYGVAAILVATDQQTKRAIVQAVVVIFSALLNLIIIKMAGIQGVAYVYILSVIFMLVGYSWVAINYRNMTRPAQINES